MADTTNNQRNTVIIQRYRRCLRLPLMMHSSKRPQEHRDVPVPELRETLVNVIPTRPRRLTQASNAKRTYLHPPQSQLQEMPTHLTAHSDVERHAYVSHFSSVSAPRIARERIFELHGQLPRTLTLNGQSVERDAYASHLSHVYSTRIAHVHNLTIACIKKELHVPMCPVFAYRPGPAMCGNAMLQLSQDGPDDVLLILQAAAARVIRLPTAPSNGGTNTEASKSATSRRTAHSLLSASHSNKTLLFLPRFPPCLAARRRELLRHELHSVCDSPQGARHRRIRTLLRKTLMQNILHGQRHREIRNLIHDSFLNAPERQK